MKNILALLAALITLPAAAQDTAGKAWRDAPSRFRNDISFFTSGGGPGTTEYQSSVGIIYRRSTARDPQRHWRLGLGTGTITYNDGGQRVVPVSADTALLVRPIISERMYYALAGVGIERPFWRQLHVTASLEGQASYGRGTRDSLVQLVRSGVPSDSRDEQWFRGPSTNSVSARGLLVVGFRTYHGRLTAAVEGFSGVLLAGRWTENSAGLFDFNLGGLGMRLSAGLRF